MVKLGAWSSILLVLGIELVLLGAALAWASRNRLANRYLAALMVVLAGMLVPFIIGYAGFYDAWPWLSFAPFAVPLAVGPLLYGHLHALARGEAIGRRHFIAPALQFGYQAALFPTSLATKNAFADAVGTPLLEPVMSLAVLVSMTAYAVAAWRDLRAYERWLAGRRRQDRPARRIRVGILLIAPLIAARAGYALFEALVRRTDYFDMFGYYVLLGGLGVLIGVEGWRNADAPAPPATADPDTEWNARGAIWLARLSDGGWWRDPDLDLAALARHLGTNSAHLSRGLAGSGGFAAALATLRAEAVAGWIDAGSERDLLGLAMDAGFGSKASFNRAFSARFGMTPSAYRSGQPVRGADRAAMAMFDG